MALRKIEDEVKQDLADNIRTYEADHMTINDGFEPDLIPDFSTHDMRHTFCTRFHECGPDDKALQEIMGHADFETTRNTYTHSSNEAKHKAVKKLQEGERFF